MLLLLLLMMRIGADLTIFPNANLILFLDSPVDFTVKPVTCVSELCELYRKSCKRHHAIPIEVIMKHLDTLDLNSTTRRPILNLREQNLTAESCEALEEVLKRVSRHFPHFCRINCEYNTQCESTFVVGSR